MANMRRSGYHDSRPTWRGGVGISGAMIGVELEVEATGGEYYQSLISLLPDDWEDGVHALVERDGSLSSESGMEIVFPPASYVSLKNGDGSVTQAMNSLRGYTYDADGGNAGMHLNVNTAHWSAEKKMYFTALFNSLPQAMLEGIGGRRLTNYCRRTVLSNVSQYVGRPSGHDCAASYRSNRVELRFPRSTTNVDRLRALVILIELAEDFCQEMAEGGYEMPLPEELGELFISYLRELGSDDSVLVLDWMENGRSR